MRNDYDILALIQGIIFTAFLPVPGGADRYPNCNPDRDPDGQIVSTHTNRDSNTYPNCQADTDSISWSLFIIPFSFPLLIVESNSTYSI